jgi:hypothetical protein
VTRWRANEVWRAAYLKRLMDRRNHAGHRLAEITTMHDLADGQRRYICNDCGGQTVVIRG